MAHNNLVNQIFDVFISNVKSDNRFLDVHDIGQSIFGNGYIPKTYGIFDRMIKTRMYEVREFAEQNGYLIIPKRKPTKNDKTKKFIITSWKIATTGDDNYIRDELAYKISNGEAKKASTIRFANTAVKTGILPEANKILAIAK